MNTTTITAAARRVARASSTADREAIVFDTDGHELCRPFATELRPRDIAVTGPISERDAQTMLDAHAYATAHTPTDGRTYAEVLDDAYAMAQFAREVAAR